MFSSDSSTKRCRGFTLLELVGTLTIVALLSWVMADGVLARLREAQRQNEAASLAEIAQTLRASVLHQRSLPADTNWPAWVAMERAEPRARIATNNVGWARRLIYEPGFRVGPVLASPPYTQTTAGSVTPTNTRAVLISTVAADFPSLTNVRFDDIWECPSGRLPTRWSSRWNGQPADLLIERLQFGPSFCRVCLNNLNLDAAASFAIDQTNQVRTLSAAGRWEATYFGDSRLLLLGPDGSVQRCERLQEDVSYSYEAGRWEKSLTSGFALSTGSLASAFDQLTRAPRNGSPVSPAELARAMHELLGEYVNWARSGFPRGTASLSSAPPVWRRVIEARQRVEDFSSLLIGLNPP